MSYFENSSPPPASEGQRVQNALELGPRRKPIRGNKFVHHGRHFGRTVHGLCQVQALISNSILHESHGRTLEDLVDEDQRKEYQVYLDLVKYIPGVSELLTSGTAKDISECAELIQSGINSARSDDTKGLKGVILDWIIPRGCNPSPPLLRNVKSSRGYNHDITGALLCPASMDWKNPEVQNELRSQTTWVAGDDWPIFLYEDYIYDIANVWNGLLRSELLVNGYKHIFTSPSSVDKEPKATRSGNARIHGMNAVTRGSIAYVATQVRFALSSASVFSRTDKNTDSERFYTSLLNLLNDVEEIEETTELLDWWNRQIFPRSSSGSRQNLPENSPLAQIRRRRAAIKAARAAQQSGIQAGL